MKTARKPDLKLADQDRRWVWAYRVIAESNNGRVVKTESITSDDELDASHDRLMAIPGVDIVTTMGPFRLRLATVAVKL